MKNEYQTLFWAYLDKIIQNMLWRRGLFYWNARLSHPSKRFGGGGGGGGGGGVHVLPPSKQTKNLGGVR